MSAASYNCPRCAIPLADFQHEQLRTAMCPSCRGLFFEQADLARAEPALLRFVKTTPLAPDKTLACPSDGTAMEARRIQTDHEAVVVDCCPSCSGLWLDRGELAILRKAVKRRRLQPNHPPVPGRGHRGQSPEQRAQTVLDTENRRLNTNNDESLANTGAGWTLFALLTDLPVEGYNPVYRTPVATYALMAICVAMGFGQMNGGLDELALVPDDMWRRPHTLLTSMFMHADIVHLLVNLYFLKICGDNVEDRLGRAWFLVLFLGSGLLGGIVHGLLTPSVDMPMVGASGGISGILAAYVWFFPDVRLSLLPLWWFAIRGRAWIHLRALFYIPIWFLIQLAMLAFGVQGIAIWAHIGGFLGGLGLTWWMAGRVPDARIANLAARIARGEDISGS
jgi:membrane associated rhomboid family serine protease